MENGFNPAERPDQGQPELARRAGELLREFAYTRELHLSNEGFREFDHDVRDNRQLLAKHTPPVGKVECLVRAFLLDAPTAEDTARQHLGDEFVGLCLSLGLFRRLDGGLVTGTVNLVNNDSYFLISDHNDPALRDSDPLWVMGHSGTSDRLTWSLDRRPYRRMLDLCSGSGVQAFEMAPFASEIVSIDANPRALEYGRLGAAINGFSHIEFRQTDMFSAVAGETFDLIAANPPFVVNGASRQMFTDGGMGADRFSESLIRQAGQYLCEGGFAHVISDVISFPAAPAEDRLREWVGGSGCDALIFAGAPSLPPQYVDAWLSLLVKSDPVRYQQVRADWLKYLTEIQAAAIQHHFVCLRRRTSGEPNWAVYGPVPPAVGGPFGHQVARLFRCIDLLRGPEEDLLSAKLRVAPEARLTMIFSPGERNWQAGESTLSLAGGLAFSKEVPGAIGRFAGLCDGQRTVREIIASLGQASGLSLDDTIPQALPGVRDLLAFGFVDPAAG